MITQRSLPDMVPKLAARALVVEAPTVKQWGPFFRARYPSPKPHTIFAFVFPFTRRSSLQLRLVRFDRP